MTRPGPALLDHLTLTVTDLDRSRRFYDTVLAPLGLVRVVEYVDPEDGDESGVEATGYGGADDRVVLWLVAGSAPTANMHLALRAADADAVAAFFAAATGAGATVHRRPRTWAIYRPARAFSAMVGDPDANIVEAVVAPSE